MKDYFHILVGFISLDCGLPIDASPYTEPYNGIIFTSDEKFVQSGKTGRVGSKWSNYLKVYMHLRYFPDGKKNCINLSITKDTSYVIRADFLYGNYDGINSYPIFDLYLGPNKWVTVDLQGEEAGLSEEIIHMSRSNSLQVCVVKTGISTPLISSLELRPLRNGSYLTKNGSLEYSSRRYFNNSDDYMRYVGLLALLQFLNFFFFFYNFEFRA